MINDTNIHTPSMYYKYHGGKPETRNKLED